VRLQQLRWCRSGHTHSLSLLLPPSLYYPSPVCNISSSAPARPLMRLPPLLCSTLPPASRHLSGSVPPRRFPWAPPEGKPWKKVGE
jgi:hypothetical protein